MTSPSSKTDRTQARPLELPVVRERRAELETCAYCPRLCRAVCPVSNAEPREALIPWGKMNSLLATDAKAVREEPWGCTGCGACTNLCRHDNPVAEVLFEGRSSVFAAGRAPEAAVRVAQEHPGRLLRHSRALAELSRGVPTDPEAPFAVLLGCATLEGSRTAAQGIVRVASAWTGRPLRLLSECCGLIPFLAGDAAGARLAEQRLTLSLRGVERLIVADPGCERSVASLLRRQRATGHLESTSFLAWVASLGKRLARVAPEGVQYGWHPPCWARGTTAEPAARVLLKQLVGKFVELDPGCTGGGGLVPSVLPNASRRIGEARLEEFRKAGVQRVVVGCASGARRLRSAEGDESPEVIELSALVAEAAGAREP